ncbi:vacuolar basic amino acid transporter 2 [Magnaporthiopsis poae ATCC 64411]|uniref:Vacuolar basic amino acid transporter 2 n=1 Tax=Magnaporthiopsis poae (strain ATCC 64411 / 73-15) TaxID=644358 RepID=A0A0C4E9J5_MAGP6|nr:vacuolar basic amino acid transporter 2 [Magnaporthiopsis poae ATCC 64411]
MTSQVARHGWPALVTTGAREDRPLLGRTLADYDVVDDEAVWQPPPGFGWIEAAIQANVFLYGFDATLTASTYAVISSEFGAANAASWLTTSYLVTSTAFQPLYGRFSDIFGRRVCFITSCIAFGLGCLGCGLATDFVTLSLMRALSGFGGGGLVTMATIINSDLIPFRRRGMYQAMQNGVSGFGSVSGASFGGIIADHIGWRWCFLLQVPISATALLLGSLVLNNPAMDAYMSRDDDEELAPRTFWRRVDILGSLVLISAVSVQLLGLSLGGNELPWDSPWVIGALAGSVILFALFLLVEARTSATPIIPLHLLRGSLPILTQMANICLGLAAYAYLFMLPLFFQVVLEDSATTAGARLAIPSLATPLGGLIAGLAMARWGKLLWLMRLGALVMVSGNALVTSLRFSDSSWKYLVYIFPANLGQGIVFPSVLFTSLASFEHSDHAVSVSTTYLIRSLGQVWGVAITSAMVQTTLSARLPAALGDIPEKAKLIEEIRHSVTALESLPVKVRLAARKVYYEGIRYGFATSTSFAAAALILALVASPRGLRRKIR